MSLWHYQAAVNGYIAANSPADDKTLSADEIAELGDFVDGH